MSRHVISRLPPRVEYADVPRYSHNSDTVQVRTVSAAWNALFTRELTELSFAELAKEVGVTTSALYRYYPTLSALAAQVVSLAVSTLVSEMGSDFSEDDALNTRSARKHFVREVVRKYLLFAEKRPRHLSLMVSKQYADAGRFPEVARQHAQLRETMEGVLRIELGRKPTLAEAHGFWSLVHGSAVLVASGQAPQRKHTFAMLEAYFDGLRGGISSLRPARSTSSDSGPSPSARASVSPPTHVANTPSAC